MGDIKSSFTPDEILRRENARLKEQLAQLTLMVSEREIAEEGRRASEHALRRSLVQREEFIGIASHELKTPVTSIRVLAELVEEQLRDAGDTVHAAMITRLNEQVDRLSRLINDLLDTSRIEEGRMVYNKEDTALNELVEERAGELQRISRQRKIVLELGAPVTIFGDRERLAQVIVNLLSNAIKYSPDTTTITIRMQRGEGEVIVSVIDSGIGIPQEAIDKLFERFYRVGGRAMSTYPGMGLGLYISEAIIKNHGGRMFVESEEGRGSTFTFTLPLQQPK